jgi:hypothetical protein
VAQNVDSSTPSAGVYTHAFDGQRVPRTQGNERVEHVSAVTAKSRIRVPVLRGWRGGRVDPQTTRLAPTLSTGLYKGRHQAEGVHLDGFVEDLLDQITLYDRAVTDYNMLPV